MQWLQYDCSPPLYAADMYLLSSRIPPRTNSGGIRSMLCEFALHVQKVPSSGVWRQEKGWDDLQL
jgi:hypothetical protein